MEQLYITELAVLRSSLWGETLNLPADTDYEALWKEMQLQAVTGLASAAVWPQEVPEEIRSRFEQARMMQGVRFYRYLHAQEKLLALLEEHEIPAIILKGTAAAVQYPEPELRTMGDIDFLVPETSYMQAYEILTAAGYQLSEPIDSNEKHISFVKDGVDYELHRNFGTIRDPKYQAVMKRRLVYALEWREKADCCGSTFPIAPSLLNGLLLLQHAAQHMKIGIGLRHVIDWMMFVHRYLDDTLWENSFRMAADGLGLEPFARALTAVCRRYLGLPDKITWCDEGDASAEHLMAYILERGNFGKKIDTDSYKTQIRLNNGVPGMFHAMQETGMRHWRAAQKYKMLRPFAWIYGGVHYVGVLIDRRHGIVALAKDLKASKTTVSLFKELQLSRTRGFQGCFMKRKNEQV